MSAADQQSAPRRVLIITGSIGAGHNSVAAALRDSLAESGEIDAAVVDSMEMVPRWFRKVYAGGFTLGMTRLPWVFAVGYVLTNHPQGRRRGLGERVRLAYERHFLRRLREYLQANRFDLLVHTHFLTIPPVSRMIRRGLLDSPQVVTVTDLEVHRWWYAEGVDEWFAPNQYAADRLRRWGVAEECITVSGMAVRPKWTAPLDRARVCADWSLPPDKPIVLVTGGTDFVCGPVVRITRGILNSCDDAHVVVLAGRSKRLIQQAAGLVTPGGRVTIVPFTDRGHELLEVCSLMVTKPGGLTTAECLAKAKPMVLLKPVPGHEAGNARFLACNGAAVLTTSAEEVISAVARLLSCPALLGEMSDQAGRLYRPGREIITAAVRRRLGLEA